MLEGMKGDGDAAFGLSRLVGGPWGILTARAIRRLPSPGNWSAGDMDAVRGFPWSWTSRALSMQSGHLQCSWNPPTLADESAVEPSDEEDDKPTGGGSVADKSFVRTERKASRASMEPPKIYFKRSGETDTTSTECRSCWTSSDTSKHGGRAVRKKTCRADWCRGGHRPRHLE